MLEEESDDLHERGRRGRLAAWHTYILIGGSRPARGLARLRTPLPQRLMQRLPGVDVRIVADRSQRANGGSERRMSAGTVVADRVAAALLGIAAGYWLPPHGRRPARNRLPPVRRRILLPFTGEEISRRSFEAAVRLAKAEDAIIMPAFLARVPMSLPLDTALPVQSARGHAAARGDRAARHLAGRAC